MPDYGLYDGFDLRRGSKGGGGKGGEKGGSEEAAVEFKGEVRGREVLWGGPDIVKEGGEKVSWG